MKNLKIFLLFILLTANIFPQEKGHLFIVGGGSIPDYLIQKFVDLGGGAGAKFLIIPLASAYTAEASESISKKLNNAGVKKIEVLVCSRENADSDTNFKKLEGVTGIFFTGGDQSKLTSILLGTRILDKMKGIYKNGGVIGGTSAGAAIMSKVMLTGEEILNKDSVNSYNTIQKGNIKTAEGFGFIDNCIVDQHFLKRKRSNRLFSIILEHPDLTGIGIDESTSVIVNPDKTFEIFGESLVMVIDASEVENISTNKKGYLSGSGIKVHFLKSGDIYNLSMRKVKKQGK